jgi:hypothetical protein
VYVNSIDIYPQNDTLPPIERFTNLEDDIAITAWVNPPVGTVDNMGDDIHLEVTLENQSPARIFDTVVVNAHIQSAGNADVFLTETLTDIEPGIPVNCRFSSIYTVPDNVSQYTIKVFVNNVDRYPSNDTLKTTRNTNLKLSDYSSTGFALGQNIPNPAKENTRIEYSIPNDGQVIFTVYTITGQTLHIEKKDAYSGTNSIEFSTANLANGIYYYSMEYKGERLVKRMVIYLP